MCLRLKTFETFSQQDTLKFSLCLGSHCSPQTAEFYSNFMTTAHIAPLTWGYPAILTEWPECPQEPRKLARKAMKQSKDNRQIYVNFDNFTSSCHCIPIAITGETIEGS